MNLQEGKYLLQLMRDYCNIMAGEDMCRGLINFPSYRKSHKQSNVYGFFMCKEDEE